MDDFDSPMDLDGDGDDAIEMCLFFDDDKKKGSESKPSGSGGCLTMILILFTPAISLLGYCLL